MTEQPREVIVMTDIAAWLLLAIASGLGFLSYLTCDAGSIAAGAVLAVAAMASGSAGAMRFRRLFAMTADELAQVVESRRDRRDAAAWGMVNDQIVCPHCQSRGRVRIKQIDRPKGISGAKVAGAMLLGPISLLATGISGSEKCTRARCGSCSSVWHF